MSAVSREPGQLPLMIPADADPESQPAIPNRQDQRLGDEPGHEVADPRGLGASEAYTPPARLPSRA